jgi:hypothetical protein
MIDVPKNFWGIDSHVETHDSNRLRAFVRGLNPAEITLSWSRLPKSQSFRNNREGTNGSPQ